ncbi:MAG: hypothetical protein V4671_13610, partial [Armatimonadota bacterium]
MCKPLFPLSLSVMLLLNGTGNRAVAAPPKASSPSPVPTKPGTTTIPAGKLVQVVDPQQGQKLFQQAIRLTKEGKT